MTIDLSFHIILLVWVSMSMDIWLFSLSISSYPKYCEVCVWDSVVIDVEDDILLDLFPILFLIGVTELFSASVGRTSMLIMGSSSSDPNNSRLKNKLMLDY